MRNIKKRSKSDSTKSKKSYVATKLANSATVTSRAFRSGATIWATERPAPIDNMLEITKLSMATVVALLNKSISMDDSQGSYSFAVGSESFSSFHDGKVPPEVLKAIRTTE